MTNVALLFVEFHAVGVNEALSVRKYLFVGVEPEEEQGVYFGGGNEDFLALHILFTFVEIIIVPAVLGEERARF